MAHGPQGRMFRFTIWAFVIPKHPVPQLLDGLAHEALERLGMFNSLCANKVWAFATPKHLVPKLMVASASEAQERLGMPHSQASWAQALWCNGTRSVGTLGEFQPTMREQSWGF